MWPPVTQMIERARAIAWTLLLAALLTVPATARATGEGGEDHAVYRPYFLNVLVGAGSERDFSELLTDPFSPRPTSDRIFAISVGREFHRTADGRLAFEVEGLYAFHWPDGAYHEFGASVNARWYDFPWNHHVPTSFAIGVGPSLTTRVPPIEAERGHHSRLLNQFNLELTGDIAQDSSLALVLRLQHRSGIFGLINGVHGGSDFLTFGLKWRFGP